MPSSSAHREGSPVSLAPVTSDELAEVAGMASRIWPAAYGTILQPEQIDYMLRRMYRLEQLRSDLAEGVRMWWIRLHGERVGFLAVGPADPGGECPLHKCYVLPAVQGQGCGSRALDQLAEVLGQEGARSIGLRVNRHNTSAIGFYRKKGFVIHAEDCRDIGGGFVMDDFLMRKDLPS